MVAAKVVLHDRLGRFGNLESPDGVYEVGVLWDLYMAGDMIYITQSKYIM
jgi:hypothetical protein